jgi:hypothetical protein
MNTTELYVEPILIGALALALLALPFAPGIVDLSTPGIVDLSIKLPSDIALGAILVGIAYLLGILVDRLIDSCLGALERHHRVRFALSGLIPDDPDAREAAWDKRPNAEKDDLFPEDQYQWRIFAKAEKISDRVNYVRTRIRLLRALAFLLPGLVFAGALGAVRLSWSIGCTPPPKDPHSWVRPAWCDQTDCTVALPVTEASWMPFLAPCLYVLTALAAWALSAWDSSRWRRNRADNKRHVRAAGASAGVPAASQDWRRAGLWRPPNTRKDGEMVLYASARAWPVGDWSDKGLWIDILAQPVSWCSVLLLLAAVPAIIWLNDTLPGLVVGLLAGPLLTLVAGWAWWRTTETFMRYLKDSNQLLTKNGATHMPKSFP